MLDSKAFLASLFAVLALAAPGARSDDWTSVGSDAQRSSWVRSDAKTSPSTVRAPEFRFLWKIDLPNEARSGNALTAPALLDFLISHRGFRSLAFVGGSSGGVYVMDTDLARMEWERHFLPGPRASTPECPGGMTANLTRPTAAAMPSSLGFGARGRRSPAKSGVGRPKEGAVTLAEIPASTQRPQQRPASARTRPPARRALRGVMLVYALSADGMLHSLYVSNGRDRVPPVRFLQANVNARGLIVVDGTAYVASSNSCNGAPDAVWALDLESGTVISWKSDGGSVVGSAGVAFGPDGTVYATTSDGALVALDGRTLALRARSEAVGFLSSPVVFDHGGSDCVAAVARDGSLRIYEGATLAQLATASAGATGQPEDTALAAWRDPSGTHWVLVPAAEGVTAWRVDGSGDAKRVAKGWESPRMDAPLPPIIVNGVVFALDGGPSSGAARLYALDGTTGRALWDSGDSIKSTARGNVLSAGPGQVYLTTSDSAVYAFGFPMER